MAPLDAATFRRTVRTLAAGARDRRRGSRRGRAGRALPPMHRRRGRLLDLRERLNAVGLGASELAAEAIKADCVPVDVSQFTPAQVARVREFVEPLGQRVFIVGG